MEEPLISVIITTYKRSNKIERAIQSVLHQTYKNIEVIIVDDNANEIEERKKTKKIVEKYPEIKYIQNSKNLGGALARNVGIDNANGEFIAFLDDDDEYKEDKLEKQFKCYEKNKENNVGMIYCYCYIKDENNKIIGTNGSDAEGNVLYEHMKGGIAGTSLWFCPKEVLLKIGKFEDTPSKQDFIVTLKMLANGYNIYRVPECLVYYYEHGGNGISGTGKRNIIGLLKYREWCRKYYDKITKQQIRNVEYNFSKQLLTLYIFNNMRKEAKQELKNMIKLKPFYKKTIIGSLKYLFPKQYLNELERKQNGKNK